MSGRRWQIGGCTAGAPVTNAVQHLGMRCSRGFTLMEVIIVVVIVGILAVVALPSYMDSVRKGRRTDAFDAATRVQQEQERYRSNNSLYADTIEKLALGTTSAGGHYNLALSEATSIGYTLTITPVSGGKQAADAQCASLSVTMVKGSLVRKATSGAGADSTEACWPR